MEAGMTREEFLKKQKACPRCQSQNTEFLYWNNKKEGQPPTQARFRCATCCTTFTLGGKTWTLNPKRVNEAGMSNIPKRARYTKKASVKELHFVPRAEEYPSHHSLVQVETNTNQSDAALFALLNVTMASKDQDQRPQSGHDQTKDNRVYLSDFDTTLQAASFTLDALQLVHPTQDHNLVQVESNTNQSDAALFALLNVAMASEDQDQRPQSAHDQTMDDRVYFSDLDTTLQVESFTLDAPQLVHQMHKYTPDRNLVQVEINTTQSDASWDEVFYSANFNISPEPSWLPIDGRANYSAGLDTETQITAEWMKSTPDVPHMTVPSNGAAAEWVNSTLDVPRMTLPSNGTAAKWVNSALDVADMTLPSDLAPSTDMFGFMQSAQTPTFSTFISQICQYVL